MFETPLRLAAVLSSTFVLLGWGLFALDEVRAASGQSATAVAGRPLVAHPDPTPGQERLREHAHGPLREAVDDVNDVLLAPFAWVSEAAANEWARRTVPTLIALLVLGFGLGFAARYARGTA